MSGLLYIVNFIHEGGILYTVKQFFLLAFIVIFFFNYPPFYGLQQCILQLLICLGSFLFTTSKFYFQF